MDGRLKIKLTVAVLQDERSRETGQRIRHAYEIGFDKGQALQDIRRSFQIVSGPALRTSIVESVIATTETRPLRSPVETRMPAPAFCHSNLLRADTDASAYKASITTYDHFRCLVAKARGHL